MLNVRKIQVEIDRLTDSEIWTMYAYMSLLLKSRGLIRTRNIVGERGEFLAISVYASIPNEPKLQAAPEGTQNVDALSRKGDRYSIKTITFPGKTTGVFHGIGSPEDDIPEKKFEYLIIVVIDPNFSLKHMIELTWEQFLIFRKWHSTMKAWNINLTKEIMSTARTIYSTNIVSEDL
jgi:hypothetical protein